MVQWVWVVAALPAAWVALQLLSIGVTTIGILRASIWPVRVLREPQSAIARHALCPTQRAALEEIEQLGFATIWLGSQEIGARRVPAALLAHADGRSYCGISFQALPHAGYPIVFYGFNASGQILETTNRRAWARADNTDRTRCRDVEPANLPEHWQAHQQHWARQSQPTEPQAARAAIWSEIDGYFARLRRARAITPADGPAHFRFVPALRMATRFYRARRRLLAPYASAATAEPLRAEFFVEQYEEMEQQLAGQAARPDLKATVLVLSMVVSLVLWGLIIDWRRAVILVGVIVLHEFGHAIAMRAFGWRDLSMFFVPFLGAVVTGRPSQAPAWKQALILLAGPLPGLLAGVGVLYWLVRLPDISTDAAGALRDGALIAVSINLFNLLPFTPLDGGRLVEIALFSRWPWLRAAFALLSVAAFVAIAAWTHSTSLWVIIGLLALGLRFQWTMTRLHAAWDETLPKREQLVRLFGVLETRLRIVAFSRQWSLARAVFTHGQMRRPRRWESAMALAVLAAIWALPVAYAVESWQAANRSPHVDSRTATQRAFDAIEDDEDPTPEVVDRLGAQARALSAEDPRQVDLAVMRAMAADPGVRLARIGEIVRQGRDGVHWSTRELIREQLADIYSEAADRAPAVRLARLREGLAWAQSVAPGALAPTVDARLRTAEALDDGGDTAAAQAMLTELTESARSADDCQCLLRRVLRARAWFHLSHGESAAALALLTPSGDGAAPDRQASLDYAWALVLSGQQTLGLARMRAAAYVRPPAAGWLQSAAVMLQRPARLAAPLDLAFALHRAGRDEEARAILKKEKSTHCDFSPATRGLREMESPWQRERDRLITETALALCPAPGAPSAGQRPG